MCYRSVLKEYLLYMQCVELHWKKPSCKVTGAQTINITLSLEFACIQLFMFGHHLLPSLLEFSLELQLQEYGSFTLVGLFIFENTNSVSKVNYF